MRHLDLQSECGAFNCDRPHPHPPHVTRSYYLTYNPDTNRFEFDMGRWTADLAKSLKGEK